MSTAASCNLAMFHSETRSAPKSGIPDLSLPHS